jgi:hypothetical protein
MEGKKHIVDEQLNAALKEYGAVEPRPGLENRIMANLRGASKQETARTWRWWPVLVAVASMWVIGTAVLLKTRPHSSASALTTGTRPAAPAATPEPKASGSQALVLTASRPHRPERQVLAAAPRLEHFPSLQPLSEQEELLARYIEQYPHEAVVVARAQTELMKQEMIELELPPEAAVPPDSQLENR